MVLLSQSHLRRLILKRRLVSSHTKHLLALSIYNRKHFSSLPQPPSDPPPPQQPKPTSLSARMSFVFDQIDAIERERLEKDKTLQRIRAWRQARSINNPQSHPLETSIPPQELTGDSPVDSSDYSAKNDVKRNENGEGKLALCKKEVQLAHPWPEWLELMERLVQQNYFDHKRKDEDKMIENLGFNVSEVAEEQGFDFTRDFKTVQNSLLNFGRDRFDIMRSLSRQDLQILVGYGCPSTDKRVTFSAKVLRKHVHLDEGDVCSSCSLRSSCEKAYLLTNKEDEARTVDVMRVLLTYGFDPINGSVVNKSLLKMKSVKTVVRKLLHEVVKLSAVTIDPNLPPPVMKKPPPKVKQPPPPPKKRVGRDDIEMKKGDWLCPKCDFMNFAKNTVCLQCDAKRPKRQLLPGEWECPQCNFLNYRRNVVCFHCESKRPPDEFTENQKQAMQGGSRMRMEKVSRRPEVSNAWNFDFDDDESDGADVAAFEYADSNKIDEDFPSDKQAQAEVSRGYQDGPIKSAPSRMYERDYSSSRPMKSGMGFDDFDDEDDDVENYEIDTRNEEQRTSRIDLSELEDNSDSDDIEMMDSRGLGRRQNGLQDGKKSSRPERHRAASSLDDEMDFGSDDDLPIHPKWKSSHVANSKQKVRGRGALSFGSDDELGFSSGADESMDEDFRSRQQRGNKMSSNGRGLGRRGGVQSQHFSDLESDDELDFRRGKETSAKSKRNMGRARRADGRNFFENDFDVSSRRTRGNSRGSDSHNFGGSRSRGSYNQQRGKSNNYNKGSDSYYDDQRFKRPRINVR